MSSAAVEPLVTVWSNVVLEGWHCWPSAPKHRSYLAYRHRHLFHVSATIVVSHNDREVEFHDLRDMITDWWQPERAAQSCEDMARELHLYLTEAGLSVAGVTVSEDGYDGASLVWL